MNRNFKTDSLYKPDILVRVVTISLCYFPCLIRVLCYIFYFTFLIYPRNGNTWAHRVCVSINLLIMLKVVVRFFPITLYKNNSDNKTTLKR